MKNNDDDDEDDDDNDRREQMNAQKFQSIRSQLRKRLKDPFFVDVISTILFQVAQKRDIFFLCVMIFIFKKIYISELFGWRNKTAY